ncbi:MAG: hypothetical protein QOJ15_4498 [Bradyrhizobium sp.]|nr:hypothetical protein [Bradyrhizobium sp.]
MSNSRSKRPALMAYTRFGKAGTVEIVSLDEDHGLRISIRGHDGRWPVSTIKFAQK